ncbi:MAG TPA: SAM-dependent methyltransferase [Streptosporangiaceae bacterium]|nr:SAM-dependent methyltransferase [Streptosporangiaceae bacterium]
MDDSHTQPTHASPPAASGSTLRALENLAATLDPRDFVITLVTGEGRRACLTVTSRHTAKGEDVYAAHGWYWWSWAERIALTDDAHGAAAKIALALSGPDQMVTAALPSTSAALTADHGQTPHLGPESGGPNIARIYDYWLDGKDHFAADRDAADDVLAEFPEVTQVARANRAFVARAVRHVAAQGVTQFIDVGVGLPTSPNVHEIARHANPAACTAYVDNDPVVLAHARALLADGPGVAVVAGDLRRPAPILADATLRALIDFRRPICVLLASVLHFLDLAEASTAVAAFTAFMAPGSYLVLSCGTSTGTDPALIKRLRAAYASTAPISDPTAHQVADWFTGLDLEPPGVMAVWDWRPDEPWCWLTPPAARIIGGVARKPGSRM